MPNSSTAAYADLYWLPLGAGGRVVRWNGWVYERLVALREHRAPARLFHAGLMLCLEGVGYAVEVGPVWNVAAADRGTVGEGPVGLASLGRLRAFRYEVRCWPGGVIPDIAEAVGGPRRVSADPTRVRALHEVLPAVPLLTWGRDEIGAGEMWNSNSVISWALLRSGLDPRDIGPPPGGRAPGWQAGLALARRQAEGLASSARS